MTHQRRPEHASHVHLVTIIEWLHDEDHKTGAALVERYGSVGKIPFFLFPCKTARDVLGVLWRIKAITSPRRSPIVHFEAHGYGGPFGSPGGLAGPDGKGGEASLPWETLVPSLRAINIASGFNLMVVGAACKGDAVIWRIADSFLNHRNGRVEPFPFMSAVGPETNMDEMLLLQVFEVFYDALFGGKRIDASVAEANKILTPPQRIDWASAYNIVAEIMDDAQHPVSPGVERALGEALGHNLSVDYRQRFPLLRNGAASAT